MTGALKLSVLSKCRLDCYDSFPNSVHIIISRTIAMKVSLTNILILFKFSNYVFFY